MKRLKILACKVLYREICLLSSNCENIIDVTYLKQGLHDTPQLLLRALQDEIDRIDEGKDLYSFEKYGDQDFDAILLGYGLCSNSICGLSSKHYKIVVPRAHDCITLFIGSKEKYQQYFDSHSGGIYWYTCGWNENTPMPGEEYVTRLKKEYLEKYGPDNADYLMEMKHNWLKEYNLCAYVDWEAIHSERHIQYTKDCAKYLNWNFDLIKGDTRLMEDFINGNWNEEDFVIIEPGQKVAQSFDETILTAED